jgi:hypothetical protein
MPRDHAADGRQANAQAGSRDHPELGIKRQCSLDSCIARRCKSLAVTGMDQPQQPLIGSVKQRTLHTEHLMGFIAPPPQVGIKVDLPVTEAS